MIPTKLRESHAVRNVLAAGAAALLAMGLAVALHQVRPASIAMQRLDDQLYDTFFKLRTPRSMRDGNIVIIAIDDKSLDLVDKAWRRGWPWPRDFWAVMIDWLAKQGAKSVTFDLLFTRKSVLNNELDDDATLAAAIDARKVPLVFAAVVKPDGAWPPFAPPATRPVFGAANISASERFRDYRPIVQGDKPSMALQTLRAASVKPAFDPSSAFRLHYYGPHKSADGKLTFNYVSAGAVLAAIREPAKAKDLGITPEMFKGKIVLVGAIAAALYDVKASPLDDLYPGVEVHATAIENMIGGQSVRPLPLLTTALISLLGAIAAAVGAILPRQAWLKVAAGILALALVGGVAWMLFGGDTIRWMPLSIPIVAIVGAVLLGLGWSYFIEDRQRRFFMKVLSQSVSPAVAEQVARTGKLEVGGQRREMTVMFTDIANFTDTAEAMGAEAVAAMLNVYLEEMTAAVLAADGTIDKYIGDAIMSFWNAPLDQPDHALRACRAALLMAKRESEIQERLQAFGAKRIRTRFGINTGPMSVGFMGSTRRSSYTVLGDSVNLASRLEGTNKYYGTRIIIAQPTAELVRERFLLRQLDVIRVKGKVKPMAIFELLDEANADGRWVSLIQKYESAWKHYRDQQWDPAENLLLEVQKEFVEDVPSKVILGRIAKLRVEPPPSDWDGVHVQTEK